MPRTVCHPAFILTTDTDYFSAADQSLRVSMSISFVYNTSHYVAGLKSFFGEGNGTPLQYSCLENPTDRGAWQATVHGVARVRHDLATKPQTTHRFLGFGYCLFYTNSSELGSFDLQARILTHTASPTVNMPRENTHRLQEGYCPEPHSPL